MRHRTELPQTIDVDVTTHDEFPGAAEYARSKIGELGRYTSRPVLQARVKLTRHRDPAVQRPVVAQANLDVDGRPVRAQVEFPRMATRFRVDAPAQLLPSAGR